MTKTEEFVAVPKSRLDFLIERDQWLSYLESAGVDNWDGYGYAFELKEQDEKESE